MSNKKYNDYTKIVFNKLDQMYLYPALKDTLKLLHNEIQVIFDETKGISLDQQKFYFDKKREFLVDMLRNNETELDYISSSLLHSADIGDIALYSLSKTITNQISRVDSFTKSYNFKLVCHNSLNEIYKTIYDDSIKSIEKDNKIKNLLIQHPIKYVRIPTSKYITEREVIENNNFKFLMNDMLEDDRSGLQCSFCNSDLKIWSTSNHLIPKSNLIEYISTRIKSDNRRNAKLTEILCHNENSNINLRSLLDNFGLAIILPDIENSNKKEISNFIQKVNPLDRLKDYTNKIPTNIKDKYLFQTAMMSQILDISGIEPIKSKVDMHLAPTSKLSNFEGIRLPIEYMGVNVEIQIKSLDYVRKANNPLHPSFHLSYAVRKGFEQKESWNNVYKFVFSLLNEVYSIRDQKDHFVLDLYNR